MFDRSEVDGEPVLRLADGARLSSSTSFDGMTEEEFRNQLAAAGYGEPSTTAYGPNADGEFHTHDFSALLMVTDGEFQVVLEDETKVLKSGDWCEVVAGTVHCEQTGANGATVVAGTR